MPPLPPAILVSEAKAVTLAALAAAIGYLRRQADEIRLLRGLLPVCMHCKKIRDGQGSWHPMESYISNRTEARFSHGICPNCLKQHCGELLDDSRPTSS